MKKSIIIILLISYTLTSCGILIPFPERKNYPTTTFYVKNNSNETINFSSCVIVFPMSRGPLTRNFSVRPKDSILTRQVEFKRATEPQKWFLEFKILPNDNVKIFDPNKPENWKKGINTKGKPIYTFTIAE